MSAPLHVYLQDHLAGAMFGVELVERCRRNNEGSAFADPLAELARDIASDRETLVAVMRRLGAKPSRLKVSVAWTLEKVQRLKPNGGRFAYTPLARVVELESLALGITGKRALWRALEQSAAAGRPLEGLDLAALAARAEDQLTTVEQLRLEAARSAFSSPSTESEARSTSA
jgi:hypothetical protein